ncbi:MAG: hypothetical protein ACI8VC_002517 [Candidatus Endobugula sp.]|jgi:hypothetical protein
MVRCVLLDTGVCVFQTTPSSGAKMTVFSAVEAYLRLSTR